MSNATEIKKQYLKREQRFSVEDLKQLQVVIKRSEDEESKEYYADLVDVSRRGLKFQVPICVGFAEELLVRIETLQQHVIYEGMCTARHMRSIADNVWEVGCSLNPHLPDEVIDFVVGVSGKERRAHPRISISHQAEVRRQGQVEGHTAQILNLSLGGFCLSIQSEHEVGERVKLQVEDPDQNEHLIAARIRWQNKQDDGTYLVGCSFVDANSHLILLSCLHEESSEDSLRWYVIAAAMVAMFVPPILSLVFNTDGQAQQSEQRTGAIVESDSSESSPVQAIEKNEPEVVSADNDETPTEPPVKDPFALEEIRPAESTPDKTPVENPAESNPAEPEDSEASNDSSKIKTTEIDAKPLEPTAIRTNPVEKVERKPERPKSIPFQTTSPLFNPPVADSGEASADDSLESTGDRVQVGAAPPVAQDPTPQPGPSRDASQTELKPESERRQDAPAVLTEPDQLEPSLPPAEPRSSDAERRKPVIESPAITVGSMDETPSNGNPEKTAPVDSSQAEDPEKTLETQKPKVVEDSTPNVEAPKTPIVQEPKPETKPLTRPKKKAAKKPEDPNTRVWRNHTGQQSFRAVLVKVDGERVILKDNNGKKIVLNYDWFSVDDLMFLAEVGDKQN